MGTASDRYAGWIGQIYPEIYRGQIKSRSKTIQGRAFREERVPVESVADYFERLDILELDFTFYTTLREADGTAGNSWHVLSRYGSAAPSTARFLVKAPKKFTAPRLRRSGRWVANPSYLNGPAYVRQFLDPARELLGDRLVGVVFEQGYQRKGVAPSEDAFVSSLDAFFQPFSFEVPHHLEIRTPNLLGRHLNAWAYQRGVGLVLSHWNFLPPLNKQWLLAGGKATAFDRTIITRLLTPSNMDYAESFVMSHPFASSVPAISESKDAKRMIQDVVNLIHDATRASAILAIIANNRAWGNAPDLLQAIVYEAGDLLKS